ncbi:MAG: hypothetical protein PVJ76_05315 [Gemmatimonadota bacterium]|jgi:hypothetical protein
MSSLPVTPEKNLAMVPNRSPTHRWSHVGLVAAALLVSCTDDDPLGPKSPSVSIFDPAPGSVFLEGASLHVAGAASDPQDGVLPDESMVWTSSIDGAICTGSSCDVSSPSVGVHTISLVATDSDGNRGTAAVSVVVQELDFLDGTLPDPEIGLVVSSLENGLRLFQVGDPGETRDIALGASSSVTATGLSVWGEKAAVPLGNAASVAIIDLRSQTIEGFFLFPAGNATGSTFVDQETVLVANQETDEVGKFNVSQDGRAITETVAVPPNPTDIISLSHDRVLVVSSNLDEFWSPAGEGIVTAIDPTTMTVTGTVSTGGENPQFGALGPDGLLYVPNTGNYFDPSSMAVIDPQTMTLINVVEGLAPGSADVHVDEDGLVYVSGFLFGCTVWESSSETFLRGPGNAVCAPGPNGFCRGASSSVTGPDGTLYQTFFGSPGQGLPPWVFTYSAGSFELTDSIPSGRGPIGIQVRSFRSK